jgi:hypothetical protein
MLNSMLPLDYDMLIQFNQNIKFLNNVKIEIKIQTLNMFQLHNK